LGLGRHLVHELGFEDGVDTLGRWMSHHLAELIDRTETGPTPTERRQAFNDATATIIRLWEHRTVLPGRAYPLSPYQDAARFLALLDTPSNPYLWVGSGSERRWEGITRQLFQTHSLLVFSLTLKSTEGLKERLPSSAATAALTQSERHLLSAFQSWVQHFMSKAEGAGNRQRTGKRSPAGVDFDTEILKLIDEMERLLHELKQVFPGPGHPLRQGATRRKRSTTGPKPHR
jgi:hypothetical protein